MVILLFLCIQWDTQQAHNFLSPKCSVKILLVAVDVIPTYTAIFSTVYLESSSSKFLTAAMLALVTEIQSLWELLLSSMLIFHFGIYVTTSHQIVTIKMAEDP